MQQSVCAHLLKRLHLAQQLRIISSAQVIVVRKCRLRLVQVRRGLNLELWRHGIRENALHEKHLVVELLTLLYYLFKVEVVVPVAQHLESVVTVLGPELQSISEARKYRRVSRGSLPAFIVCGWFYSKILLLLIVNRSSVLGGRI